MTATDTSEKAIQIAGKGRKMKTDMKRRSSINYDKCIVSHLQDISRPSSSLQTSSYFCVFLITNYPRFYTITWNKTIIEWTNTLKVNKLFSQVTTLFIGLAVVECMETHILAHEVCRSISKGSQRHFYVSSVRSLV